MFLTYWFPNYIFFFLLILQPTLELKKSKTCVKDRFPLSLTTGIELFVTVSTEEVEDRPDWKRLFLPGEHWFKTEGYKTSFSAHNIEIWPK